MVAMSPTINTIKGDHAPNNSSQKPETIYSSVYISSIFIFIFCFFMEFEFSSSSILLSSLLFLFLVLHIRKRSKNNGKPIKLPPGPPKLPIIGNLHQLGGSKLPHSQLRDLAKKYGPFMHLQLGEISTCIVSSAGFAEEVMKTHDAVFASRPFNPIANFLSYDSSDIIFSPYGDYWRQLRKLCTTELLSKKRVQSFRSIREEEALNLMNWIVSREGTVVNLTDKVNSFTGSVTSRAAFGKKWKDQELFISAVNETGEVLGGFNIADVFPSIKMLRWISTGIWSKVEKLHQVTDKILENIINEHKQGKANTISDIGRSDEDHHEDLVDVLLKAQEDGDVKLTTENIKAVIWDVFSAGIDTAATTIDWAMSELVKHPRLMKKAQAEVRQVFDGKGKVDEMGIIEMKYLGAVVKETLRLHPPATFLGPRESGDKCEIKGFNLPIKTKILVNAWAIGRDPEYWSEPESFIPERFLDSLIDFRGTHFEYLPFGAGRRMCPGMSFGLANVEHALAMLLYHFDWKLPDGMKNEDLNMTEAYGITVKRKGELCLIPIPYRPSATA